MMTTGKRLKKLRKDLKLSQSKVAELCGWDGDSNTRVSNYERDERKATPDDIKRLAKALKTTPEYIQFGVGESATMSDLRKSIPEGKVPVIGWDQIDHWIRDREKAINLPPDVVYLKPQCSKGSDVLFALKIKNDLMVGDVEQYPVGSYIIVDSEKKHENGAVIVGKYSGAPEAILRQYYQDGGGEYLTALKPGCAREPIGNLTFKILGVVIEKVEIK